MSRAARLLERRRGKEAFSLLRTLNSATLPLSLRGEYWFLLGQIKQERGDFHASYRHFLRAYNCHRRTKDDWTRHETALKLGDVCRQRELFHEAIRWYISVDTSAGEGSERLRLDARCGKAMALRGLGRYDEACSVFQSLLTAYRKRNDTAGTAYVLWALGTTERFAGLLKEAKAHLRAAVKKYERMSDPSGLAYARCALGGTLRMCGEAEESRRLYAQAAATFRRLGDDFGACYSACGQSNGLRMQERLREAAPFMAKAERGYRRLRMYGPLGFVLWSRAQLHISQQNFPAAQKSLRAAAGAFTTAKDPRGLVYVELGWGELKRSAGGEAAPHYRRALAAARRLSLRLEETHASVRLGLAKPSKYRRLGVSMRLFSSYTALP